MLPLCFSGAAPSLQSLSVLGVMCIHAALPSCIAAPSPEHPSARSHACPQGFARVMSEHEWLALHDNFGLPVHIFRCGGIYGGCREGRMCSCRVHAQHIRSFANRPGFLPVQCVASPRFLLTPSPSLRRTVSHRRPALAAGPGRSALEAAKRALAGGEAPPSAARRARQRHTARCHVYDICQVLEASMRHPRPGAAYNIADDDPADRATVMAFAQDLLQRKAAGLPPPGAGWGAPAPAAAGGGAAAAAASGAAAGARGGAAVAAAGARESVDELVAPIASISTGSSSGSYDSADEPPGLASWRSASTAQRVRPRRRGGDAGSDGGGVAALRLEEKRVRNGRIKQELGVQLAFPSYREGLAAIVAGDRRPFEPLR